MPASILSQLKTITLPSYLNIQTKTGNETTAKKPGLIELGSLTSCYLKRLVSSKQLTDIKFNLHEKYCKLFKGNSEVNISDDNIVEILNIIECQDCGS